jgi:hypothetical protein
MPPSIRRLVLAFNKGLQFFVRPFFPSHI